MLSESLSILGIEEQPIKIISTEQKEIKFLILEI